MFKAVLTFAAIALVATSTEAVSPSALKINHQIVRQEVSDYVTIADCDLSFAEKKPAYVRSRACLGKKDCQLLDKHIKSRKRCKINKSSQQIAAMEEDQDQGEDALQAYCTEGWSCIAMMDFGQLDRCISEGNLRKQKARGKKKQLFEEEDQEEELEDDVQPQAYCSSAASCNAIIAYMRQQCNELSQY